MTCSALEKKQKVSGADYDVRFRLLLAHVANVSILIVIG